MPSYVYVIAIGDEARKIGLSDNPERRLKELQTGCPVPFYLDALFELPTREIAAKVERLAHSTLEKLGARQTGEWFNADRWLCRRIIQEAGKHFSCKPALEYWSIKFENREVKGGKPFDPHDVRLIFETLGKIRKQKSWAKARRKKKERILEARAQGLKILKDGQPERPIFI